MGFGKTNVLKNVLIAQLCAGCCVLCDDSTFKAIQHELQWFLEIGFCLCALSYWDYDIFDTLNINEGYLLLFDIYVSY